MKIEHDSHPMAVLKPELGYSKQIILRYGKNNKNLRLETFRKIMKFEKTQYRAGLRGLIPNWV